MYVHIDYPHHSGYMIGCGACETRCHCTGEVGVEDCVYCQELKGTTETLESISTHDLKPGDIVLRHGMRLRLNGEGTVSRSHPTNEYSPTLWWNAEILNIDDVRADPTHAVPRSWIADGRWTVQGNGLARWTVERESA